MFVAQNEAPVCRARRRGSSQAFIPKEIKMNLQFSDWWAGGERLLGQLPGWDPQEGTAEKTKKKQIISPRKCPKKITAVKIPLWSQSQEISRYPTNDLQMFNCWGGWSHCRSSTESRWSSLQEVQPTGQKLRLPQAARDEHSHKAIKIKLWKQKHATGTRASWQTASVLDCVH